MFNDILRLESYPADQKTFIITMIPKPPIRLLYTEKSTTNSFKIIRKAVNSEIKSNLKRCNKFS